MHHYTPHLVPVIPLYLPSYTILRRREEELQVKSQEAYNLEEGGGLQTGILSEVLKGCKR